MSLGVYLSLPFFLTLGIALAIQSMLVAHTETSLGRVGAVSMAGQTAAVALAIYLAVVALGEPREERCPISDGQWLTGIVLLFGTAGIGGVVLATVVADWRRQHGALVWHLLAAPLAIVLPYVVVVALMYWGLTCMS